MNIYMKGINHMRINSGLQNELDLIKAIDGKRFDDFGNNIKNLMKAMYDDFDDDIFVVTKEDPRAKPDIAVTYHGKTFHISIKSGGAEHIHCEDIKKFILSLRARGISKETQKTILKFQFGDGTLDGTGKDRLPYQTIFLQMQDEIKAANIELNRNRELVVDYVTKFLFHGNHEDLPSAEHLISVYWQVKTRLSNIYSAKTGITSTVFISALLFSVREPGSSIMMKDSHNVDIMLLSNGEDCQTISIIFQDIMMIDNISFFYHSLGAKITLRELEHERNRGQQLIQNL